jgi:hypothetical protein
MPLTGLQSCFGEEYTEENQQYANNAILAFVELQPAWTLRSSQRRFSSQAAEAIKFSVGNDLPTNSNA